MRPLTARLRILFGTAVALGLILISQLAHAEPLNGKLVSAVLGEALHDQKSMDYMAHAVLNRFRLRGDLKGVYGYVASQHMSYGPTMLLRASNAVRRAYIEPDPTLGATHWLSDYDLTHCRPEAMKWKFKMKAPVYQGQTHFYREKL